jgi:hypothetical protein
MATSNQTGRTKDDVPTLKNKVAEVKKIYFISNLLIYSH